jgi:hypothetical protein
MEHELAELRKRLKTCEVALLMFYNRQPRIDPRKLALAYFTAFPEPIATQSTVEAIVGVAQSAERRGRGEKSN